MCVRGASAALSTETLFWIPFSSTLTVSSAADISLKGMPVFEKFDSCLFAILVNSVICFGCLSMNMMAREGTAGSAGQLSRIRL